MRVKRPVWWSESVLLLLLVLTSCDQTGDARHMMAEAEEAKREGELLKAAGLYHQAEQLSPQDFEVHFQLALVSLDLDDLHEAEEHPKKAVALRPDSGPAHLNLGVVLVEKGYRSDARKAFLQAVQLDPRLTRAITTSGSWSSKTVASMRLKRCSKRWYPRTPCIRPPMYGWETCMCASKSSPRRSMP
jgi:tetratricopeptide (TPR) repeat protein